MKSQVREWLEAAQFQEIVKAAFGNARIVRILVTLTYDYEPLICWRSLDAIGRCAAKLCAINSRSLRNLLRRLFWQMSDECGSIAWRAPETIGEIVRADPVAFRDFIPLTIALLDLEPEDRPPFLPGILYALGRIGEVAPDGVKNAIPRVAEALAKEDSQARAMAVWCIGRLPDKCLLLQHPELAQDQGKAVVYRNERLVPTTVGCLYSEALK